MEGITAARPARSRAYRNELTDTDIWDAFALRPGDVIVSTPPKCGTTWTQAIVTMLIHGRAGTDVGLRELSPWLDCGFRDRAQMAAALDAQTHRRCIKTHTPLDGIPYDPGCTYVTVFRHPVDAHFSMRDHVSIMKPGALPRMQGRFPEDERAAFAMFVDDPDGGDAHADMTLEGIAAHYLSFRPWAALPNVHFFHYADMARDRAGQVARMAGILGIRHPREVMEAIVGGASFATMQGNAVRHEGGKQIGLFTDASKFFASGSSGKWQGRLTEADMERYRARIRSLLPAEDIDWLENGGAPPGGW